MRPAGDELPDVNESALLSTIPRSSCDRSLAFLSVSSFDALRAS